MRTLKIVWPLILQVSSYLPPTFVNRQRLCQNDQSIVAVVSCCRWKTNAKPSLVTWKINNSLVLSCISGKRSLKSHHLGDNQVLAFLLYERTERFCHEPEKIGFVALLCKHLGGNSRSLCPGGMLFWIAKPRKWCEKQQWYKKGKLHTSASKNCVWHEWE